MMVVDARKLRDRDQQEEVGSNGSKVDRSGGGPPGLSGIRVFMILLFSDGRCFHFFPTLELDMSSLAFNGKRDKGVCPLSYICAYFSQLASACSIRKVLF